jgi:autotransporter-associated beta strand protein
VTETYAIFQGQSGTVTVDNSLGQIRATGMQFLSDGYVVNGGPITLLEAATESGSAAIQVALFDTVAESGSAAIQVNPGMTTTIDSVLQGNVQLRKTNLGTLVLNGANTYTGGTALNAGVLQVSSDGNLGDAAGGLSFDGGTLQVSSTFATHRLVNLNTGSGAVGIDSSNMLTLDGVVAGTGSLIKTLGGTLVLTADNTYMSGTAINGGVLQVASDSNLGAVSGYLSFDGGTLHVTDSFTTGRDVALNTGGGTVEADAGDTLTLEGLLSGSGALTKGLDGTVIRHTAGRFRRHGRIAGHGGCGQQRDPQLQPQQYLQLRRGHLRHRQCPASWQRDNRIKRFEYLPRCDNGLSRHTARGCNQRIQQPLRLYGRQRGRVGHGRLQSDTRQPGQQWQCFPGRHCTG